MSAPVSTLTSVAYIYKVTYSGNVGDVAERAHPLMKMLSKQGGFTGTTFNYPMKYGNAQGVAGGFTTAQANATSSKGLQFAASRFKKYGIINLDGEALMACDSKGSFIDMVSGETDSIITEHIDHLAFDLYRDGSGVRGRRSSASTNVITLSVADDARNFKVGMTVGASSLATGLSPRTGTTTVASVQIAAGTVTLTSAAAITSFADNDYLFVASDPGTCMEGLDACTPLTAPSASESFRTKDRSVYPELLAGSRVDDTSTNAEENAGLVAVKIAQLGGRSDSLMLNPINFYKIARRMNAKIEYGNPGGEADYGFEHITIHSPAGSLKAYSDPDCPTNRGRVFLNASHYIKTLGEFTHIIMDDGRPNLRSTDADGIEARTRSMGNYIQSDTRNHGVFSI